MGECTTPFSRKNPTTGEYQDVPCGKCLNCYKRKVSQWSFRLMQQEKIARSAHFVTLTYDNDHIPITKKRYMGLVKDDLQKYFKRLRKLHYELHDEAHLKYYAVGEYGGNGKRPHYHIILFNSQAQLIVDAWQLDGKPIGEVHIGTVTGASIGYTLKYISKTSKIPEHKNDDRQPEFALMSKGLGANYLTPKMIRWHKADKLNRMYVNIPGGQKVGMPRYLKERLYTEEERKIIGRITLRNMLDAKQRKIDIGQSSSEKEHFKKHSSHNQLKHDVSIGKKL